MPEVLFAPWRYEYLVAEKSETCIFCEAADPAPNNDDVVTPVGGHAPPWSTQRAPIFTRSPIAQNGPMLAVGSTSADAATSTPTRAPATSSSKPGGYYLFQTPNKYCDAIFETLAPAKVDELA